MAESKPVPIDSLNSILAYLDIERRSYEDHKDDRQFYRVFGHTNKLREWLSAKSRRPGRCARHPRTPHRAMVVGARRRQSRALAALVTVGRDQLAKRPVLQSHGITLSFHREMADSSRELVGPDITAAVTFESYPRFIKGGFEDDEGVGIKRSPDDSKHVPSLRSRLLGNNIFRSLPQKVVESLN